MGMRVHVLLDRIDRQQRRLQFALLPDAEAAMPKPRRSKTAATADGVRPHSSPKRTGKKKARAAGKKGKGKRN
jgi:ribonuclease R